MVSASKRLSGGSLTLFDEWNEVDVCLSEKTLKVVSPPSIQYQIRVILRVYPYGTLPNGAT